MGGPPGGFGGPGPRPGGPNMPGPGGPGILGSGPGAPGGPGGPPGFGPPSGQDGPGEYDNSPLGGDREKSKEKEKEGSAEEKDEIDLSGEIWVETKSDGGKSYYYNATTRATQWTKPEGENVKILTQGEVEALQKKIGKMMKEEVKKDM